MKAFKKLLLICLTVSLILCMIACNGGGEEGKLTLSADKTSAKPGETVTLSAKLNDVATSEVTYEITEGEEYATVTGNSLTVSTTAEDEAKIKVVAKTKRRLKTKI